MEKIGYLMKDQHVAAVHGISYKSSMDRVFYAQERLAIFPEKLFVAETTFLL